MSFVSWQYPFLLVLACLVYWQLPGRARIWLLWLTSYFFYGSWDPRFLVLIYATSTVDFLAAIGMKGKRLRVGQSIAFAIAPVLWLAGCGWVAGHDVLLNQGGLIATAIGGAIFVVCYHAIMAAQAGLRPRLLLGLSLFLNLATLAWFKYFNFFVESARQALLGFGLRADWPTLEILLPVGISFYTFQSLSYVIDVYRGDTRPTDNWVTYSAYASFFPQLVAGPIERSRDLLPQIAERRTFSVADFHFGARCILLGLFKKIFVADNCALIANYVFSPGVAPNAYWSILGVVAFAFQIYGDFSGYSDIARGSALWFGVRLSLNFKFPYSARGPSEFWARWHITLSSWFRDYLYIPLGGNRTGKTLRNLMITMLLAGLWHGANWMFILWGAFHGALLVLYRMSPPLQRLEQHRAGLGRWAAVLVMFMFTLFGWAIFRCGGGGDLFAWLNGFADWNAAASLDWRKPGYWLALHIVPLLLLQWIAWRNEDEAKIDHLPMWGRIAIYVIMILATVSSARIDQEFIYFQF